MLRRIEASGVTRAPLDRTFAVVVDYESYPDWLPGLAEARILSREGDVVMLEVRAPRFRGEKIVLELIHAPPAILFHQVEQFGKPELSGRCEVSDAEGGAGVHLELRVEMPLLGLASGRPRERLDEALARLAERVAELEAGRARGRRKILEIRERDGDLEILMHSQRYRLVRRDEKE